MARGSVKEWSQFANVHELVNSPSASDGVSEETETQYRLSSCAFRSALTLAEPSAELVVISERNRAWSPDWAIDMIRTPPVWPTVRPAYFRVA